MRSAEALERMERVDTLVVDKTGTLTEGKMSLAMVTPAPGFAEADMPAAGGGAGAAQRASAGRGHRRRSGEARHRHPASDGFRFPPAGGGVRGRVEDKVLLAGNRDYLEGEGVVLGPLADQADAMRRDGASAIFLAVDGRRLASSPSPMR